MKENFIVFNSKILLKKITDFILVLNFFIFRILNSYLFKNILYIVLDTIISFLNFFSLTYIIMEIFFFRLEFNPIINSFLFKN